MPISFVVRKIKKQPVDFVSLSRTAGRVHLAVLGLTGLAGAARVSQLDPEGVEDRGYRLYYNSHQGRTDVFATVGAGVGVLIASLALRGLKPPATPASYLGCLSLGVTGGVLAHVLTTASRGQEE